MNLPLRLDAPILTVFDAHGETVLSAPLSTFSTDFSDRLNAERARELRFIVAAANYCGNLQVEEMERRGTMPVADALRLSLVDPKQPSLPGPLGLVKTL